MTETFSVIFKHCDGISLFRCFLFHYRGQNHVSIMRKNWGIRKSFSGRNFQFVVFSLDDKYGWFQFQFSSQFIIGIKHMD